MKPRACATSIAIILLAICSSSLGQQPASNPSGTAAAPVQGQTSRPLTATARLAAAKTVYLVQGSGNSIPYNVISSAFESWPRYAIVESRKNADLIVEISAPEDPSGISVQGTTIPDSQHPESRAAVSRTLTTNSVKMAVLDPRTGLPLWSGTEDPRGAMKKRAREDNLVEAAQRLFARFRDQMEPPQAGAEPAK